MLERLISFRHHFPSVGTDLRHAGVHLIRRVHGVYADAEAAEVDRRRREDKIMSVRDFVIFFGFLIVLGIFMATGLLLLIAPDRVARLWWMRHGPLTEEDLQTRWQRANARLTGAVMVAMGAYVLWTSFFRGAV